MKDNYYLKDLGMKTELKHRITLVLFRKNKGHIPIDFTFHKIKDV